MIEQWGDGLLGALLAGAAAAGALFMKFGGVFFKTQVQCEEDEWKQEMLEAVRALNTTMERYASEITEMHKVVHTNSRVVDDQRQEIGHLRESVGELKGMMK